MTLTDEEHQWLAESCAASGVPYKVEDPQILRTVAALFDSALPGDLHTLGVEPSAADVA